MSAAHQPGRLLLRPYRMYFAAGLVWVVDAVHPVAALLDPSTGDVIRLVDWAQLAPGSGQARNSTIVADDDGLWVQYGLEDSLARVTPDGVAMAVYSRGARLVCAGIDGAWMQPAVPTRRDRAATPDVPPRTTPTGRVWHVSRDGTFASVPVDGVVLSMTAEHGRLFVTIGHEPWTRVPVASTAANATTRYEVEWTTSSVSTPLNSSRPEALSRELHASPRPVDTSYGSDYADEYYNEDHLRKRADSGPMRWHWGRDPGRAGITLVRAYRDADPIPLWADEIRDGRIVAAVAVGEQLWVNVRASTAQGGGERVEIGDSLEHKMIGVDSVDNLDITDHRWPVGPEPADHASYVEYCVSRLDDHPFSDKVSDVVATWVGEWPDGRVQISFRHSAFPGVELRSWINLYDEVGRKLERVLSYASAELFEQAGTHAYPDVARMVDGTLDVRPVF